jgi:phosphate-selective porin
MRRHTSVVTAIALAILLVPTIASAHGPLLTIHGERQIGTDNLHISGHGPANTPVTLHVGIYISRDIPDISLGDNDGNSQLMTDGKGIFATNVSIAVDNWEGSLVHIDATVPGSRLHAVTDVKIGPSNIDMHSPTDHIPDH